MMELIHDPEFWVAVAFVIVVVGGGYKLAPTIAKALDDRAARIKAELEEAQRLRDDAQKTLAEYQRKQREAVAEAATILAGATAEAERMMTEAKAKMEEFIARRSKMAETKIAQAEAQALADVRAAAAEAAVSAAQTILTQTVKGDVADRLIVKGIDDVKSKLN